MVRFLQVIFAVVLLHGSARGSLQIEFDYTYDTANFFSAEHSDRRITLERAAELFESRILDDFAAINPAGGDTWTLSFPHPSTGEIVFLQDLSLPKSTIRIFVGARDLPGNVLGYSEFNYSWSAATSGFFNMFSARTSTTNFDSLGGSISFDTNTPFYFDEDPSTLEPFFGQNDFYSLAVHEIGHLLGISASVSAFHAATKSGEFVGAAASTFFGGPVPLAPDLTHVKQGTVSHGQESAMMLANQGVRRTFSELDFAILQDIGYEIKLPEPVFRLLVSVPQPDGKLVLSWIGGVGPFQIQSRASMLAPWMNLGTSTSDRNLIVDATAAHAFFRVVDLGRHP